MLWFNIRGEENTSNIFHVKYLLLKDRLKKAEVNNFLQELLVKKMISIFYKIVRGPSLSIELTFASLKSTGLKSGTDGFVFVYKKGLIFL